MIAGRRRIADLPLTLWVLLHTVAYLAVTSVGLALWGSAERGSDLTRSIGMVLVSVVWAIPLVITAGIAATAFPSILKLRGGTRGYGLRLTAVLVFAAPLPLFLLTTGTPADALLIALIQTATALIIVQPVPRAAD
ncbi:hypothetical protein [Actinoplanes sp. NPDC051494]|uniref:hypothetical protein n=1 Tax=Actinoplanes sp. NPDC051494 TaxID=3363907 RepID=UPI0037AC2880